MIVHKEHVGTLNLPCGVTEVVDAFGIAVLYIVQHANRVRTFLQQCADINTTLNTNMGKFCQTEVTSLIRRRLPGGFVHYRCHPQLPYTSYLCSFLVWQTNPPHATTLWHHC